MRGPQVRPSRNDSARRSHHLRSSRRPSPRSANGAPRLIEDLGQALTGDLFTGVQASADKAMRELERRATGAWQRYTAQKMPDISAEVLTALEDDPRAGSTVARIMRLSEGLRRLRDRPIPSPEALKEFDETTAQLRSAWSVLDVASLSEEIVAFLRAANSAQGAPLDSLTEQVREWLEQRGAAGHYVIRPADQ